MSARKKIKVTVPVPPVERMNECGSVGVGVPTPSWPSLLPELLQQVTTYSFHPSAAPLHVNAQLLCRLSAVCVPWHAILYCESSNGYIDFWSHIGSVSLIEEQQLLCVGERRFRSTSVVLAALFSLRLARALTVLFNSRPPRSDTAAIIHSLQHFSRLTSLHINLGTAELTSDSAAAAEMRDALNAALTTIAFKEHSRLISLMLYCPETVQPNVDILRRLCSSVRQLSLSPNELLLMAWGTAPLYERVWRAHSVQTFAVARSSPAFVSRELAIAAIAVSLPSLSRLYIDSELEASSVSALLQRMGSRLAFLQGSTTSLLQLPSAAPSCTALVSLCIYDRDDCKCQADKISDMFRCLTLCPSLTELTVISCGRELWPTELIYLTALPRLLHLHLHLHRLLDNPQHGHFYPVLCPSLTHLALVLHQSQLVTLFHSIDFERLPQLTHCHVDCTKPSSASSEWRAARDGLKGRLGSAWCEAEEDVACLRVDRVWRKSLGLPDHVDDYSARDEVVER